VSIRTAVLVLAGLVAGCSAFDLSEAECRAMDWRSRGYADGYGGHPAQDISLERQCRRFAVAISQANYASGWSAGHDEHVRLKSMKCD